MLKSMFSIPLNTQLNLYISYFRKQRERIVDQVVGGLPPAVLVGGTPGPAPCGPGRLFNKLLKKLANTPSLVPPPLASN